MMRGPEPQGDTADGSRKAAKCWKHHVVISNAEVFLSHPFLVGPMSSPDRAVVQRTAIISPAFLAPGTGRV